MRLEHRTVWARPSVTKPFGLLALLLALACACAGSGPRADAPPSAGARAWANAVAHDRPRAAYDLLSSSVRKHVSYAEFERRWRVMSVERARQSAGLASALAEGSQRGERGRLTLADGKTASLVHEPGGWRLETPLLSTARAATPQEALRIFAAAVEARSFDGVLRIITNARRERVKQTVDSFATSLKAHLREPIEIVGDRATLTWTDGRRRWRITLRKEDGEWRVDDFDPQ